MKILLFGATGMVGQGVLRECLLDPDVSLVQTIGRTPTGVQNSKLREVIHKDLWNYGSIEANLSGFDACFFCLGTTSSGMNEADYTRVTYDLTLAAAQTLSRLNPQMTFFYVSGEGDKSHLTFVYVSGEGADSSEKGRTMWARVRGKTENALLRLPFKAAYVFRPGFIQPLNGVRSKTPSYRILYSLSKPLMPILSLVFPKMITTTARLGRAMLAVAKNGAEKKILRTPDFDKLAED